MEIPISIIYKKLGLGKHFVDLVMTMIIFVLEKDINENLFSTLIMDVVLNTLKCQEYAFLEWVLTLNY